MTAFPVEGACICGRVKLKVGAPPIITLACHCRGCQRMSASAFSLTAMIPQEAFAASGETRIGALHGPSSYVYCAWCLNWVYTAPEGVPFINVRSSMFDMPAWSTPFIETFVSEKLPWAATPARHGFERFPPPDRYGALLAEYAAVTGG